MGEAWRTLTGEHIKGRGFFGKRKKRLDPADFVAIKDGFTTIDICHSKCAGQMISILSVAWDLPQEIWSTSSLKIQLGGIPIVHDLHCVICPEGWQYEQKHA